MCLVNKGLALCPQVEVTWKYWPQNIHRLLLGKVVYIPDEHLWVVVSPWGREGKARVVFDYHDIRQIDDQRDTSVFLDQSKCLTFTGTGLRTTLSRCPEEELQQPCHLRLWDVRCPKPHAPPHQLQRWPISAFWAVELKYQFQKLDLKVTRWTWAFCSNSWRTPSRS